ncbi:MAG TPA: glycosyltransferase family 4 protein [Candidatus Omnitrophota bacterium]|nr:glycosyltransferase family 4 protein [Candidatus Omnitrophota bacterium]HRZ15558.1 glycosyltransferase family 4 protein [Candidatus Omnitrophota bacterium]
MKIVFLIANIDTQTGGMERQALQLAAVLKKRDHQVFFISPTYTDVWRRQKLSLFGRIEGIRVVRIPFLKGCAFLNAGLYALFGVSLLVMLQGRYSVIHAHQIYTSGVVAGLAACVLRNKTVVVKNGAGNATGDIAVLKTLRGWRTLVNLINGCKATIVCVNEETRRESEKAGFKRVVTIPNGIDRQRYSLAGAGKKEALRAQLLEVQPEGDMVLFVGRLGPEKNVATLIKALSLVKHDCFLSIVGDGVLRKKLIDFAAHCGSAHKVVFAGASADVARWYRAADVFVLPSYSEGMPNVLLEAMASGLPVIASAIPSIQEIIDDGYNGLLFPPEDEQRLADQIDRILDNRAFSEQVTARALGCIEARFDFLRVAQQYEQIYLRKG